MYKWFLVALLFWSFQMKNIIAQSKHTFGIGAKLIPINFTTFPDDVSPQSMIGLTVHFDSRIKGELHSRVTAEINSQTIRFSDAVSHSFAQTLLSVGVSYPFAKFRNFSIWADGSIFTDNFTTHSLDDDENFELETDRGTYSIKPFNTSKNNKFLNYGLRSGVNIQKVFKNNNSLHITLSYIRSLSNHYNVYFEERYDTSSWPSTTFNTKRSIINLSLDGIQFGVYYGFGIKKLEKM